MNSADLRKCLAGKDCTVPGRHELVARLDKPNVPHRAILAARVRAMTDPTVKAVGVTLELHTQTECNTNEHWRTKAARAKHQRKVVRLALLAEVLPTLPVRVMLTRMGPQALDEHDNLPSAFKHVIDEIASLYGVEDDDHRLILMKPQQKYAETIGMKIRLRAADPSDQKASIVPADLSMGWPEELTAEQKAGRT